jgi:hypothetical protein
MSKPLKPRRGTTAEQNAFVGEAYEVTYDTDKNTLVCRDGLTAGGFPLAKEEEVSSLDSSLRAFIAQEVAKCLKTSGGTMTGPLNLGGHGVKDAASLELAATEYGGHIDFHFGNSTQDYTTRIIEQIEKRLDVWAKNGLTVNGHPVITSSLDVQFIAVGNNKTLTAPSGGTWVCMVLPWRTDGVNNLSQFQWFSTGGKIAKVAGGTALRTCGSTDAAVAWCFRVA